MYNICKKTRSVEWLFF